MATTRPAGPPKVWYLDCAEPWYSALRTGKKTIEGRKGSPKYRDIAEGDLLRIGLAAPGVAPEQAREAFYVTVVAVRRYAGPDAVRDYLQSETLARALPGVETLEEGVALYAAPPVSWTGEEVARHGVIAIEVRRAD
jgi:ASC-1-like (ASCH) protein